MSEKTFLTLLELNSLIKEALEDSFPDLYWVVAEIASVRVNRHCYLELVERRDESVVAQMRATLWAHDYKRIVPAFESATGEKLKKGMKVMLLTGLSFHEVYGMSLNIKGIDPTYTLGEMARKKQEIIERLGKEGLIDLNKRVPFPLVPQRIAVISSSTAAGYGDFIHQLEANPYCYRFSPVLFPALMQGDKAEESILKALDEALFIKGDFDTVVIIRGGGGDVDLSCFDSYGLGAAVASFPLPVLAGIGHHRDESVVDMVSHASLKTPTAVAEFLIGRVREFEHQIDSLCGMLVRQVEHIVKDERHRLTNLVKDFTYLVRGMIEASRGRFAVDIQNIRSGIRMLLDKRRKALDSHAAAVRYRPVMVLNNLKGRLNTIEQALKHLDPVNVLKRAYSITTHDGHPIKRVSEVKSGDTIMTMLYQGTITSKVERTEEGSGD